MYRFFFIIISSLKQAVKTFRNVALDRAQWMDTLLCFVTKSLTEHSIVKKNSKSSLLFSQLTKIKRVKLPILAIFVVLPSDSLCFITGFFLPYGQCFIFCHCWCWPVEPFSKGEKKNNNKRNKWPWPSFTITLFDPWGPDTGGFHWMELQVGVFQLWCFLFVVLLTKDVIGAHPITWHQSGNTDGEKKK